MSPVTLLVQDYMPHIDVTSKQGLDCFLKSYNYKDNMSFKMSMIHPKNDLIYMVIIFTMRGSRMFCQGGSTSDNVFLSVDDERTENPHNNKSGPSSAHQRNTI